MGPKKGKGSKLARMSDEERARYLQHRAAIEEEARRRKEQLIETFMKNKLKKEEAFSRLNVAKINQQWRVTLRVFKCSELKQDLEALFVWFNHTSSKKSKLIESLIDDLKEAEGQYSRIHQCHMETVDKLLIIYNQRISQLQEIFEGHRDRTYEKARADVEEIVQTATSDQEHLHAIIFQMHQTSKHHAKQVDEVHNTRIDELRNSMLTELENLVNSREALMETLWHGFQAVLQNYWTQTEDRRREYLNLKDTDGENCQQIFQYHQQIKSLNDVMQGIRKQLGSVNNGGDERVVEKKAEKASCTELYHVLRRKLVVEKEADRKKLCFMTEAAENTTKNLKGRLTKCQKIVQLVDLCRKFETLDEQDISGNSLQLREIDEEATEEEAFFNEPLAEEEYRKCKQLDGFWKRYSKVFLEKEALFLQHKALQKEQKHLKAALKQYFVEFSTNPAPPKGPLVIERATGGFRARRPMSLVGERVPTHTGKTSSCGHAEHAPSFMHRLTIELTKQ